MKPDLPRRFGRYALFDFIGKGGMAEIYLARAKTELGVSRLCVVKQILPALAASSDFSEMLIYEAKLAARLSHANIVQVFDLGKADERLFIAMEYIEGFDLNELLKRCSRLRVPLPFEFALFIVGEALRGLDYAHRRVDDEGHPLGIVHRDVSPSNVLVSCEGEIKLCDFGIARANDIAIGKQEMFDEQLKGKAGYMSPEQARGQPVDARSDVFAAGVLLWELLSGRRMYRVKDDGPSLWELAKLADIPPLEPRNVPRFSDLEAIVMRALSVDREARFPTAQSMATAVSRYMTETSTITSPLRLGDWLVEHFGEDMIEQRRARERAIEALERGNPVSLQPLPPPPVPAPSMSMLPSALSREERTEHSAVARIASLMAGDRGDIVTASLSMTEPRAVTAPGPAAASALSDPPPSLGAMIPNVGPPPTLPPPTSVPPSYPPVPVDGGSTQRALLALVVVLALALVAVVLWAIRRG